MSVPQSTEAQVTIPLSPEAEAKFHLITRRLQEATSTDIIRKVLSEDRVVKAYWGELRLQLIFALTSSCTHLC